MRVKTDDRRQAIVSAALTVFRELGYERASMTEISAQVGGSKSTLYSYFKSKAELYAAAMLETTEEQKHQLLSRLNPSNADMAEVLEGFGKALLALITTPAVLAVTRTAMAEGATSHLGALLYDRGPRGVWGEVAAYLARLMAAGAMRPGDPEIDALHFKGLLEAGILEPSLYGAVPRIGNEVGARRAVETFLRACGAEQKTP
jgi:AcrR family transcriptional regulator